MARSIHDRDLSDVLAAGKHWIASCLVHDGSIFGPAQLWNPELTAEVRKAFVDHPDFGDDDFITKLKGQLKPVSSSAQKLAAEMLWALLLFLSNVKASTKRRQIIEVWELSGDKLDERHPYLQDSVLWGIGSGGPGFNNYRPLEVEYLIELTGDLKAKQQSEREAIFAGYDAFVSWIDKASSKGRRQFRHMLRYFSFPDSVERMSSNNDRASILQAFEVATKKDTKHWTDRQFDEALLDLRKLIQMERPKDTIDFYMPDLRRRWGVKHEVKTEDGNVSVTVPMEDDEDIEEAQNAPSEGKTEARQSFQVQAKLAEIGVIMGFKIWTPRSDRVRVKALVSKECHPAFLEDLPLNYDGTTLSTIEQIDLIWLKGRSIARAFEVEHTTAVYSGLLRMADLLALQPNMDIRLHIVAPDERRDKVFYEMQRPVFSLLEKGPLSRSCTFLSYDSVNAIRDVKHLEHTSHSIIAEYEETAPVS